MYIPIYNHVQSLSPTFLWVRKLDVKLESLNFIFKTHMKTLAADRSPPREPGAPTRTVFSQMFLKSYFSSSATYL